VDVVDLYDNSHRDARQHAVLRAVVKSLAQRFELGSITTTVSRWRDPTPCRYRHRRFGIRVRDVHPRSHQRDLQLRRPVHRYGHSCPATPWIVPTRTTAVPSRTSRPREPNVSVSSAGRSRSRAPLKVGTYMFSDHVRRIGERAPGPSAHVSRARITRSDSRRTQSVMDVGYTANDPSAVMAAASLRGQRAQRSLGSTGRTGATMLPEGRQLPSRDRHRPEAKRDLDLH